MANGTPAPAKAQCTGLSERPEADGYRLTRGLTAPSALLRAELAALLAAARWWEKAADWLQVNHWQGGTAQPKPPCCATSRMLYNSAMLLLRLQVKRA